MTAPAMRWLWPALLYEVVDGDTIDVILDVGFGETLGAPGSQHGRIRLKDVWAAEVRGKLASEAGQVAKEYVIGWFDRHDHPVALSWPYLVETFRNRAGQDERTFERYVGVLWCRGCGSELNEDIVAAGFATKTKEGEAEL